MARTSKKTLILQIAKQLFAKKGYDATGMEEIASKAEIPKSLIYYHFKSKEDILNSIITEFIEGYDQVLHNNQEGIDKISVYIDFLKQNRDSAKVIISESLKTRNNEVLFFKVLAPLMGINAEQEPTEKLDNSHWVAEFFTSIVPTVLFACYEDSWCSYFNVTAEQLEKDFVNAYKLTHGAYHKHINKESL